MLHLSISVVGGERGVSLRERRAAVNAIGDAVTRSEAGVSGLTLLAHFWLLRHPTSAGRREKRPGVDLASKIPCVLSIEDKARWVFFVVDSRAPWTYISPEVSVHPHRKNA
jgi:hypothetical protein